MTRQTVAALYIDGRHSPYLSIPGVDCWPEERNAALYAGTLPIVAHPPCGPWGRYAQKCSTQRRDLAPLAVEQLRTWGGVLEHPRDSKLWAHCNLPRPGDRPQGELWTLEVEQGWWGHRAPKPTWLLFCGLSPQRVALPAHRPQATGRVERLSKLQRRLTPPEFAGWLVSLARVSRVFPF